MQLMNMAICSAHNLITDNNPGGYVCTHRGGTVEEWIETDIAPWAAMGIPIMLHGLEGFQSEPRWLCDFRGKMWPTRMRWGPDEETATRVLSTLLARYPSLVPVHVYLSPPDIDADMADLWRFYARWISHAYEGRVVLHWDSGAILATADSQFAAFLRSANSLSHQRVEGPWPVPESGHIDSRLGFGVSTMMSNWCSRRDSEGWEHSTPDIWLATMTAPEQLARMGIDTSRLVPGAPDYPRETRLAYTEAIAQRLSLGETVAAPLGTLEYFSPGCVEKRFLPLAGK